MNHSLFTVSPSADDQRTLPSAARAQNRGGGIEKFAELMARHQGAAARQQDSTLSRQPMVLAGRSPSDVIRAQVFSKAKSDLQRTNALEDLMQNMAPQGDHSLALAGGYNAAQNLRSMAAQETANMRSIAGLGIRELQSCDFIRTRTVSDGQELQARVNAMRRRRQASNRLNFDGVGKLSAQFESGSDGIAAIGYDRTGGTSYGKYQIASRVGSMSAFLNFLDDNAPDLSQRLRAAGPANTGSRQGAMPEEWRKIAAEQPERFESLQEEFIHESHYRPALDSIAENTRLDTTKMSSAMREVIWSTAVQHGPAGAARLFSRADGMSGRADAGYERRMISNVYALRAGQFGSSESSIQAAVSNRFKKEAVLALNMLDDSQGHLA